MQYSKNFKFAYVNEFLHQLHSRAGKEWPWLHEELMVGSVFYQDSQGIVYCTPAVSQYLGGEEVPDDNNVRVTFGHYNDDGHEEKVKFADFVLTYDMGVDLSTYLTVVNAYRAEAGRTNIREELKKHLDSVVLLSTSHLSEATKQWLEKDLKSPDGLMAGMSWEYGWMVFASNAHDERVPADLRNILRVCEEHEFYWVRFDGDALSCSVFPEASS